nr:EOG090X017M [Artemia franciscana]
MKLPGMGLQAKVDSAGSANRPAATKSAGVIGKWGITSFTSLRSSCISSDAAMNGSKYSIGKKAKTVPLPVFNSETAVAPAPKKFFKSRGQTEENIAPSSFACHVKESTNGELQDNLSRVPLTAVSPPQKSQSLSAGWNGSGLDCRRPMYTGDILIGQSSSESNSSEDDSYSPKGKKTKGNKKTRKGKKIIVTPSCRTLRAKKVLELEDPPPPQMDFDSFSEPKVDNLKPKPAIKLRIVRNKSRKAAESVNVDEMNLKTEAPSLDEDLPLSKRNNRTKRTVKPSENVRQLSIQEESDLKIASDGQLDLESCQKDVPEMKELSLVVDEKLQNKEVNNIDCSIIDAVEEKLASLFGSADGNETSAVSNIGLEKKVENDLLKEVIEPEVEQIESQQVLPESCDTVVSASEVVKDSQATLILSQESDSSQSLAGPQYNLKDSQETVDFEKSAIKEEGDMQPVEETDSSTNQCIEKEKVSFDNAELFENLECRKMEVNYGKIDITSEMSQNSPERVLQPKKAFFKNRSQRPGEYTNKKAFSMYKHVWVDDPVMEEIQQSKSLDSNNQPFKFDDNFEEPKLTRVSTWPKTKAFVDEEELITSVKCPKRAKELYTVVKNVKHAHQMQEQGEFQEYQDDVDYILDALQSGNPVATRCLAAISLAQKCLAPGFRMHLRAHGTVAKFFHALRDAPSSLSVGLCTATVMFVLSLDRLNVDLDRSSLELMLNLLDSETESTQSVVDIEYERNRIKVKQICDEVKKKKQAMHLTTDNLTTAQLAMETLLSLTSRRAGEWFKEELRELGGIEHLIETVSECVECVSATRDWPKQKLEKVVKLDRLSLSILIKDNRCIICKEAVTNLNEDNQIHLLEWKNGRFMNTLLELFRTITFTLGGVGEFCGVLKTSDVDATIKDVLLNILKFLVNMTHDYKNKSFGSSILGKEPLMFESCLVVLFVVPPRIPEENRFDLIVMVLSVIINLVENAPENRNRFMKLIAPATEDQFLCDPISACQALVRLFFECEMSAKQEERKTDDILDGKVLITREDSQNTLDPEEMVKQPANRQEGGNLGKCRYVLQGGVDHRRCKLVGVHLNLKLRNVIKARTSEPSARYWFVLKNMIEFIIDSQLGFQCLLKI